jgi:hypothetical protein
MYCKYCGSLIDNDSIHCKFCGKDVSNQKNNEDAIESSKIIGISEQRAKEWWDYFCTFSWYCEIWAKNGWAQNTCWQLSHQIKIETIPTIWEQDENTSFYLPICNRKWCVGKINFNDDKITYGSLLATQTKLAIFDFDQKRAFIINYKAIKDVSNDCPDIYINTADNVNINININLSYPSKGLRTTGWFIHSLAALGTKSYADSEAIWNSEDRDIDKYKNKVDLTDNYFLGIYKFFYEKTILDKQIFKNILTTDDFKSNIVDFSLLIEGIKLFENRELKLAEENLEFLQNQIQKTN